MVTGACEESNVSILCGMNFFHHALLFIALFFLRFVVILLSTLFYSFHRQVAR